MELNLNNGAEALGLWLGKPAPRYTSYPPAPFFHTTLAGNDCARSLEALPLDEPVSLYLHIPFCRALCLYCGCNMAVTQRDARVEAYLETVKREASLVANIAGRRRVSHLHFGGGTPNIMTARAMQDLFAHLNRVFDFNSVHEIAMELDPRAVTTEQITALASCGVTRVSLGIQDFNAEVQKVIQRIQPYDMVARVCDELRGGGINRINFDLIYGLPLQTPETVVKTAQQAVTLAPDRIALFSYAHVPQIKKQQQALEAFGIPDAAQRLEMEQAARDTLTGRKYQPVGMDHFAVPDDSMTRAWEEGTLRRNFQGYTDDAATTLIGLGASSISQTPDGFFQNERDERPYREAVDNDRFAVCRGFLTSAEDRVRAAIIERLMCYSTCDIEEICRKHDFDVNIPASSYPALAAFEAAGMIRREGHVLSFISPHRMAIRLICQAFDTYTKSATGTMSSAA